jgi:hypothetical protein
MDRKEFLKACTGGLCFCAATALPSAAAETPPKPEDWRLGFVKQRWAKLLNVLGQKLDEPTLSASLQEMGAFCASQNDTRIKKYAGDLDGFCKETTSRGDTTIARDDARKVYTVTYTPGADCFCPFNSVSAKTPGAMCNCSVGWTRHTWGIVLKKEPKVALKDSVLRGGKGCVFEITAG